MIRIRRATLVLLILACISACCTASVGAAGPGRSQHERAGVVLLTLHRVGRPYPGTSTCTPTSCPIPGVIAAVDLNDGATHTYRLAKGRTSREVLAAGLYLFEARHPSCVLPQNVRVRPRRIVRVKLYCVVF